jgi:hypothetical protein
MGMLHKMLAGTTGVVPLATYNGTVTQQTSTDAYQTYALYGFALGPMTSFGARSPTTLSDGKTFYAIYDNWNIYIDPNPPNDPTYTLIDSWVQISGFSSSPGAGYLYSATVAAKVLLGSAASYSYSAGIASWSWAAAVTSNTGFQFNGLGGTITTKINV